MTQKWNLQDIRPAQSRKRRSDSVIDSTIKSVQRPLVVERNDAEEMMSIHIVDGNKKKNKLLFLAVVIFLVVVGGGALSSAFMGGAEVTVYPIHKEPNLNAQFEAKRVPQADELAYEIMTLEAEGERQVKALGEEEVVEQSKGTIFIYNAQQKETLRLVTNTRFESADGKIFKIKDSAIIPGYTETDGKKIPGVITAEVYADQPGEEYNLGPSKFTVPGFKGEPEYANIYAESTETFMGGFKGKRFKIEDGELQVAQQALQTELRNSLLERLYAEKPAGFILFKDAVTFTYQTLPSVAYGADLATIKEKVYVRIPIFKEEILAKFLAQQTITTYEKESVRITDPNVLTFAYTDPQVSTSDISALPVIMFSLSGRPQIVWKYDSEKLKADLLNKPKAGLATILGEYGAIERATAEIRPFWKTKFPTDIKEIEITEVIETTE